jgi:predicted TIM-barrel enzyme
LASIEQEKEELIHLTEIIVSCRIYYHTTNEETTPKLHIHNSNNIIVQNAFKHLLRIKDTSVPNVTVYEYNHIDRRNAHRTRKMWTDRHP